MPARESQNLIPNSVVVHPSLSESESETTSSSGSEIEPQQLNLDDWAAAEQKIAEAGVYPAVAKRIVSQRRAEGRQPDFLLSWWGEYDDRLHSERARGPGWLAHVLEHVDDYPRHHAAQAEREPRYDGAPVSPGRVLSAREWDEQNFGVALDADLYEIWQKTLAEIRLGMTGAAFHECFDDSFLLSLEGDLATIGTRSAACREWLQHRLYRNVKRALDRVAGRPLELAFTVMERKPVAAR